MQLIAALASRNPKERPTAQAARQYAWFQMTGSTGASSSQTVDQERQEGRDGAAPIRQETLRSAEGGGAPAQVLTHLPTLRDETHLS